MSMVEDVEIPDSILNKAKLVNEIQDIPNLLKGYSNVDELLYVPCTVYGATQMGAYTIFHHDNSLHQKQNLKICIKPIIDYIL